VIEILSESSRGKDMVKKLDMYMSTGVHEYWIVNPFSREVSIYLFENLDNIKNVTFRNGESAASFIFEGLKASLNSIFKSVEAKR
jgi:Uma2 family endonuclease